MEYIRFKDPFTVKTILEKVKSLAIEYDYRSRLKISIKGVSNGLSQIDHTLCFIENIENVEQISAISNALILTNNKYSKEFDTFNLVYVDDARYVFIKLLENFTLLNALEKFTSTTKYKESFISASATVHPSATMEDNVVIEDNAIVSAGCVIKTGTCIGKGSIVRENCTIGCDGIALYKAKNDEVLRFPHVAGVYIGQNVEIGASCVIVSGTLSNTAIGNNTVIGNLSNIGHGVKIGNKVWISVGAMIGGNCTVGNDTTIGLGVRLRDNLKIGENVSIGMGSVVTKNLPSDISVFGNPAKKLRSLSAGPKR